MKRLVLAALAAWSLGAQGQEPATLYPSKSIRMIVPFTAGGAADVVARLIGKHLSETWKQPVVVENRPGADGRIGAEAVVKAPADGYTLLMSPENQFTIIPHLYPAASVNAERDLEPVVRVATGPLFLVAHADVRANSVADLVRLAKSQPGMLSYGTSGTASIHRMAGETLAHLAGIQLQHIPYKGTSGSAQDLSAGQLNLLFGQLPAVLPLVKSGKARILAVTSDARSVLLPDIPSIVETIAGWPDFSPAFGILVPKGTPQAIVEKLNVEIGTSVQSPEMRDRLAAAGMLPGGGSQAQYRAGIRRTSEMIARTIREANIKAE